MVIAKKEKLWTFIGLGVVLVGAVWLALAAAGDLLSGMMKLMGFFLGSGLVLCGLIIAGIYFYRWQRINKLVSGENILAQWKDGENPVFIARDCAYVDGNLHLWSAFIGRLEQVTLAEKGSGGSSSSLLEIQYAVSRQTRDVITGNWTRIWKKEQFSVRVPPEQKENVTKAVESLQARIAH
jgi:hypothetical protein